MKIIITSLSVLLLFSSCGNRSQGSESPTCSDPCPNIDYSMMNLQNIDSSPIYIKYLNTSNGEYIIPNTAMIETVINSGSELSLNFRNDNFNHFYFYRNSTFTNEIGKLIVLNTQPLYSTICNIKLRISGNFSPSESNLNITNTINKKVCVKSAQFGDWHFWNLSFPTTGSSNQMNVCKTINIPSSSATNFHHIYFFDSDNCSNASEINNLSKVIYRNTKSEKININNIALR